MAATFHIAMFPWFAMGHLTPFLHLANKLAKRGHKISFFVPKNTQTKLRHFNHHPDLISFHPITVAAVDGLPLGAETTADVAFHQIPLVMTAMDRTQPEVEQLLLLLKPHIVFFDFAHWIPDIARRIGIKSIIYSASSSATVCYTMIPSRRQQLEGKSLAEMETALMEPPPGYPVGEIKLHRQEAKAFAARRSFVFGSNMLFYDRLYISSSQSDALAFRTCTELEGPFVECVGKQFGKPVLLSGPVIPDPPTDALDKELANWLGKQRESSVIYCCFGSECILKKEQFQELLLGLEQTGLPFLAALKAPPGIESVEAALPQGFKERVGEKGVVRGGWVQQQLILAHPSVGCFVTHCGSGSLAEALTNRCQMILIPNVGDQIINARLMARKLKVGVEVEKGEDGFFTKESVCTAVAAAMNMEKGVGKEIRDIHGRLRELLLSDNLEESYVDGFCQKLGELLLA